MTITARLGISMGHRLMSYNGICSSPHGHNMVATATVTTGKKFIDFKDINQALWKILEECDHAMILQDVDPLVATMQVLQFRHVLLNVEPTTENIAQHIFNELSLVYKVISVHVQETEKYGATCEGVDSRVRRVN